jgi:hypothetical protein
VKRRETQERARYTQSGCVAQKLAPVIHEAIGAVRIFQEATFHGTTSPEFALTSDDPMLRLPAADCGLSGHRLATVIPAYTPASNLFRNNLDFMVVCFLMVHQVIFLMVHQVIFELSLQICPLGVGHLDGSARHRVAFRNT